MGGNMLGHYREESVLKKVDFVKFKKTGRLPVHGIMAIPKWK